VSPGVVYQQFECSRIEGHLIAEIGIHRVVIETGFPFSFGDCGTLSICGREFQIPRELDLLTATFSATDYGKLIGKDFKALMGADLLDKFDFMIDLRKMKILFATKLENIDGDQVEFQLKGNLPIVSVDLPEGTFPFLIATGNKHSFLDSSIGQHYQVVDEDKDFLPNIGDQQGREFQTPLRKVKFKLGGKSYSQYFGQYPPSEEETFRSGFGVQGVFGGDFLERKPVIFSWKRKELCLVKNI
jgi:hypothetical protein